jgi:hypothetical protein
LKPGALATPSGLQRAPSRSPERYSGSTSEIGDAVADAVKNA